MHDMRWSSPSRLLMLFAVVLCSVIATASCTLSSQTSVSSTSQEPPIPTGVPKEFSELWEVWQTLQRDYVDPKALDEAKLARGAIRGMLEALDDPYTSYVMPDHFQAQLEELEGSFEGIGIVIVSRNDRIVVVAPIRGSPADEAGIQAGDVLLAVNGESTDGMTLAEVVGRIRGESGTTVVLEIARGDAPTSQQFVLERTVVNVPTVTVERLPGSRAIVTLVSFSSQTDEALRRELKALGSDGVSGIILDLRNNPGGLVDTAMNVAGEFLAQGTIVFYEVGRTEQETTHEAGKGGTALDVPLVVLVNRGSASASEIVSGALQAHERAVLVGETTFGKGSVTLLHSLSTRAGLYVTNARWLTPNREPIEGVGLTPDVLTIDDPETEQDEVLLRALQELAGIQSQISRR